MAIFLFYHYCVTIILALCDAANAIPDKIIIGISYIYSNLHGEAAKGSFA